MGNYFKPQQMKFFAAAIIGFASANVDTKFMEYVSTHNKSYGTVEEYRFRLAQFAEADALIEDHNSQNGSSFTLGHNKMSDWTTAERKRLLGYKPSMIPRANSTVALTESNAAGVDWVTAGAVTPVKDQGQCGSCWSFSSTGSMEGVYQIKGNALTSFSEQQLVDCVTLCFGCNGGNFTTVFNQYAEANFMFLESAWPYNAKNGKCAEGTPTTAPTDMKTTGSVAVTPEDVASLKSALNLNPVSVAIEADKFKFQAYKDGVFDDSSCGTALDHAVLLVGYGTDDQGQEYWIMKNSWGSSWGDAGYMKMAIIGNGPGTCGVMMDPVYATM